MRKIISLIVLISMMSHCAGRLGILSYLYQERHAIAYTVGLIAEIPIAICSNDYSFKDGIHIQDDGSEDVPAHLPSVQEINLYFTNSNSSDLLSQNFPLIEIQQHHPYFEQDYRSPLSEIFQPPRLS